MKTLIRVDTRPRWSGLNWLPIWGLLALLAAAAPALAKEMVPYADSLQMAVTKVTENPDGSMDQIIEGSGTATHLGAVGIWMSLHIEPGGYDAARNAWVSEFSGIAVETAATGETLTFSIQGREIVRFDENGHAIFPLLVEATREVTEGSGKFKDTTGTISFAGFDQDYIWGESTGMISSVGASKQ